MTIYRNDYQSYPYELPSVALQFDLDAALTTVEANIVISAKPETRTGQSLVLDGEDITLVELRVNGAIWETFSLDENPSKLIIRDLPRECSIQIVSTCKPIENTALSGLYVSGTSLFTQCEPEGFRRICWFADRPDVMSRYRVTLRADSKMYPSLLSNGNLVDSRTLEDGRLECVWDDPFRKPSYLFALVAGTFDCREQTVQTMSGKSALLQIYSDPGTYDRTEWAMQSLVRALRWDETRFNLELDLDRFMIVVAADFNMGAMENKGLNIFNAGYVLADPQTATDANYRGVEAVIGHEYFHNWTGNRVTCRDWFELSLKEGLTVFRDQEFTADMMASGLDPLRAASARAIKRIDDVALLRSAQFPEDSGPMAHPIRPQSYEEISNFYTATVYEKGSEVIRMMHTLLGEQTFQRGMSEYFRRHDGQAVTCDDFIAAMQYAWQQEHPERDLSVFSRWYSQAGTPTVRVEIQETGMAQQVRLTLSQTCPAVGVERQTTLEKLAFHIPLAIGALDANGNPLTLRCGDQQGQTLLIELTDTSASWVIEGWARGAVASLLRDFSAPVKIDFDDAHDHLHLLARKDPNAFARWEATQKLFTRSLLALTHAPANTSDDLSALPNERSLAQTLQAILSDTAIDDGYRTRLLITPTDKYLLQQMAVMDPLAIAQAKRTLVAFLGASLSPMLLTIIEQAERGGTFDPSAIAAGKRALVNLALDWICQANQPQAKSLALDRFHCATNMTDQLGALQALYHHPDHDQQVKQASEDFYARFHDNALVIDKWFALQATSPATDVERVKVLMQHPAFNRRNPNRTRALIFQFCINNPIGFHAKDGSGYRFWAQQVGELDASNPEIAARLARVMDHWRHHGPNTGEMMQNALQSVADLPGLSPNTREVVTKALAL